MIGITEIPPSTDQLRIILDTVRECGGFIIIPYGKWNKFKKKYYKLLGVRNDYLIAFEQLLVRSVPIYKGTER